MALQATNLQKTVLLSANQNGVIFFMYVINNLITKTKGLIVIKYHQNLLFFKFKTYISNINNFKKAVTTIQFWRCLSMVAALTLINILFLKNSGEGKAVNPTLTGSLYSRSVKRWTLF